VASVYAHIADHNVRAADTLRDLIYRQAELLPHHPHAFRKGRLPDTREMVIHPHYILVYAIQNDGVTILRLLHSARNWP
jgi:addiction module RelE/StbE family toxin